MKGPLGSSSRLLKVSNNTVNSPYSGHRRDLELVSSLARVLNCGSLFQSNIYNSTAYGFLPVPSGLEPLQSPCVRRVGIGFFQICPQPGFQSLLAGRFLKTPKL